VSAVVELEKTLERAVLEFFGAVNGQLETFSNGFGEGF
jgi:hypothetical protein